MRKKIEITWQEPSEFHTNAFDLGITPLQAIQNVAHFGLSILFSLANLESEFLTSTSEQSQDHRYIRMNAQKLGEKDRYKIALQITKGEFTAPEIWAEINLPGMVSKKQALAEMDFFERTCLSAGVPAKKYTYIGRHYSATSRPAPLKNG